MKTNQTLLIVALVAGLLTGMGVGSYVIPNEYENKYNTLLTTSTETISTLESEINVLKDETISLREDLALKETEMVTLATKVNSLMKEIEELQADLNILAYKYEYWDRIIGGMTITLNRPPLYIWNSWDNPPHRFKVPEGRALLLHVETSGDTANIRLLNLNDDDILQPWMIRGSSYRAGNEYIIYTLEMKPEDMVLLLDVTGCTWYQAEVYQVR